MPQYAFTRDSRRMAGNSITAPSMLPEEFSTIVGGEDFFQGYRDSIRHSDLETMTLRSMPFDSEDWLAVYPGLSICFIKCPWNDTVLIYGMNGGGPLIRHQLRSLLMEDSAVDLAVPPGDPADFWPLEWVTTDQVLSRYGGSYTVAGTDGSFMPLPDSVSSWEFLGVACGGTCVFRSRPGGTLEKAV